MELKYKSYNYNTQNKHPTWNENTTITTTIPKINTLHRMKIQQLQPQYPK
jgi:hypothetical protein